MRSLMSGLVAPAAIVALVQAGAAQTPARTADTAAVKDVVARYVAAREARDPAAVRALFVADADQLTSSGEWRRGRENVVSGSLASSERTGGHRELTVESLRVVGADTAIADCRYVISGGAGGDRRMWSTFVMVKTGGEWRIAAIRNMLPAAPAALP
jgi:uncharacterized protein (TIGR02246 family)